MAQHRKIKSCSSGAISTVKISKKILRLFFFSLDWRGIKKKIVLNYTSSPKCLVVRKRHQFTQELQKFSVKVFEPRFTLLLLTSVEVSLLRLCGFHFLEIHSLWQQKLLITTVVKLVKFTSFY